MVKLIEILITAGILTKYNIMIIPSENICYINNRKYPVKKEMIDKIMKLIALWKNEYGMRDGVDLEEFTITITSNSGVEKIHGKGIYPNNYKMLLDIIGEIDE